MLVSYQLTFIFKNVRIKSNSEASKTFVQHLFQCQQPQVIYTGIRVSVRFLNGSSSQHGTYILK